MKRCTKIVCTIGPAVDSREGLRELIAAGMNVARINCSHGDWETRRKWIGWLRELSPSLGPIGILVDLQGPKFRIGDLPRAGLEANPRELLSVGPSAKASIRIVQPEIVAALTPGRRLLLGDGVVELRIVRQDGKDFVARVVSGGSIKGRQGLTLSGVAFETPALTDKDREDARMACELGVDFIALSYVRKAEDLRELRAVTDRFDPSIRLCAKIETRAALRNLDAILGQCDIAMVARGDLGLQIDLEEVPLAQKRIIRKCNALGKPVITATQMLESMMHSPRPTRAEAADVANAILDGTDAIMLSGETAMGEYPDQTVRTMSRIAKQAESLFDHTKAFRAFSLRGKNKVASTEAIAHAVVSLAELVGPAAIVTLSTSGQTACLVSKFRPHAPILCATSRPRTHTQLSIAWGVDTVLTEKPQSTDHGVALAFDAFLRQKRIKVGDSVLVTAGVPAGTPGKTNLILNQFVHQPWEGG